jgi:heavy metal sensor kinase
LLALGLIVPLTLLAASVSGFLFAARALAPVDQITRAAQRISANDLSQRLNLKLPDDEVGRLARTFDDMLTRLDDAFSREREFTANASHELRTPLTIMRGEIDVALRRPRRLAEYRQTLQELGADVERLTHLTEDLLMLARADVHQLPFRREALVAARTLAVLADAFRSAAETKQIKLEVSATDVPSFWGDESATLRVLSNLVENALKYSEPGGRVRLSAARNSDMIALVVADEGHGIPATDLPHIFDRFYRGRDAHADGTGLGLAIARALVLAQGGTLTIASEAGHGTTCTVRLPLLEQQTLAANH